MDADDEPTMAYFLPDGITDDSPPKESRNKASFGSIGGCSTAGPTNQPIPTYTGNTVVVSSASAALKSRSDVDFSGLHARPRRSPLGSSGVPASSPRPNNLLLSDLRGGYHTPRASRDFGDSGGTIPSSRSPFELVGPFGSRLGDGGAIGGAGAIRSPSSMFDGGQTTAEGFSMQGESRRSIVATGSYGIETQQLYRGEGMSSYMRNGESNSQFGSSPMRTWPSATEVSQPRRVLQRPPGLACPPGLSESIGMQPRVGIESGGRDMMQQRAFTPQFRPFNRSTLSPLTSGGASNRAFTSCDNQYEPRSLSSLSSSAGAFADSSLRDQLYSRAVLNPDLAELNTHSIRVGETDGVRVRPAVDTSYNREPTTSRRIDIQASSKTPRTPKKAGDGRKKPEGRANLRAKALEFSIDAVNDIASGSPVEPKRGSKMAVTINAHGDSPFSNESNRNSNDSSVPRGKRRNQVGDKGAASSSLSTGGNDGRRRETANQREDLGSMTSSPPGLKRNDSLMKLATRESGKLKRQEDTKPSSRAALNRNCARGNDNGIGNTRRQVYREKQDKECVKDMFLSEEAAPVPVSSSRQKSQRSNDGPMLKANSQQTQTSASIKTSQNVSEVSSSTKARIDDIDEAADKTVGNFRGKRDISASNHDEIAVKPADDIKSIHTSRGALPEDPATTCTRSTKRESSLSSDAPEYAQTTRKEPAEQAQVSLVQQFLESKKLKRKVVVPVKPPAESSPPVTNAAAALQDSPDPPQIAVVEKKHSTKEQRKEKSKKEKTDKKKATRGRKDKRGSSLISNAADTVNNSATEAQNKLLKALAAKSTPLSARFIQGLRNRGSAATSAGLLAYSGTRRGCVWVAGRLNMKGLLATTFPYAESVLAVVFSVVLLFSLHAASWLIRIHRVAFRAILTHRHIGFCFAFLYGFPFLVQYVFPWAPPWAPVCLWYAFLVQLFCTNGPTAMVTTFRIILPLVFLVEGISHHSFLLDLNGAELLLTSFIISALKTSNLCSPIFFLSLATQCLLAVFLGSELIVQWLQLALALYSLHVTAATDDEWIGIGEDDVFSCHPVSTHHSIVDYNHQPAPSSAVSIQKTKRLDRRALAYVRGRKLR